MPSYDYNRFLVNLLEDGAMLGSDIVERLKEKFGKTDSHCRKIINRAKDSKVIYCSEPLLFKNGQYGYSIQSTSNSYEKLIEHKPRLNVAYLLLKKHIVSKMDLLKITGVLNTANTKYYDFEKLINDLKFFGELTIIQNYNTEFYSFSSFTLESISEKKYFDRMLNVRILPIILSYCRKMNLISSKPVYTSVDDVFNGKFTRQNLLFDAIGYTNIGNPNNEKTICVFDVEIANNYTSDQYQGFMNRIETLKHSTKHFNQRVIPFLVIRKITPSFEKKLKLENKVVILDLTNIFGRKIEHFLKLLDHDVKDKVNELNSIQIIKDLGENNFANTLIRFLPFVFESLVNEIVSLIISEKSQKMLFIRKSLFVGNKYKQYDGYFEDDNTLYLIESKFHRKNKIKWENHSRGKLENDCVKYFLEDKYDFAKEYLNINNKKKIIKMCFVSANGYWKEVNEKVEKIEIETFSADLKLCMDISELMSIAKKSSVSIKKYEYFLKQYYIKNEKNTEELEEELDFFS